MDHAERVSFYGQKGKQAIPQKDSHCSYSKYQKVVRQFQRDDPGQGSFIHENNLISG